MPASGFQPTPEQIAAIHAVGGSVLVSAAAGSGKTAVLAQRCAYLVCDAPAEHRCDVDQLLVLTFTEAAAAEMRGRIIDCIRVRLADTPNDARLREQLALADAAHISTIDAFCLWLVRRWFTEVEIDPSAAVMDPEEAVLLKREVLERIFSELYAFDTSPEDPLGTARIHRGGAESAERGVGKRESAALTPTLSRGERGKDALTPLAEPFFRLVEDYGLGRDVETTAFVLRLYEFTTSVPDWRGWLTQAVEMPSAHPEEIVAALYDELQAELRNQLDHVKMLIEETTEAGAEDPVLRLTQYAKQLATWSDSFKKSSSKDKLAAFDSVRASIGEYAFPRAGGGPKRKNGESDPAREMVGACVSTVRETLYRNRLRKRFGLFSVEEWIAGLRRTAPYIATLCDLVVVFQRAYAAEKRRLNVLDFSDLERLAFELLAEPASADAAAYLASPVARLLHERFSHVLVDEFQDINPLQEAILRLVSRETSGERAPNLFAVGDIKQSIYRFRLAEPSIFAGRLARFGNGPDAGSANAQKKGDTLFLQRNFRSRPEILEAVNFIFSRLMNGAGGVSYDEHAVLRAGRILDPSAPRELIEVHIVERAVAPAADGTDDDDDDEGETHDGDASPDEPAEARVSDYNDPAHWTPIEREAYLIGERIRDLTGARPGVNGGAGWQFRDIAVLLRATKVNAERMAAMLSAMGIPANAQVGGSLFGAREVRDVVAALRALDNLRQDIPLASVLRSGIFGEQLTPDELVEVRLFDREAPFHEAVMRYGPSGSTEGELSRRLHDLLAKIERYRERARRRPLSETLWAIYEEEGFLAHCAGLPNGPQRRANLIKLHELARKFDSFRQQGLHRFLTFLESLEKEDREVDVAPAVGEADNVVRIMSIHQSKGLEFPMVFVAGLGNQFNLGDQRGRMIFERSSRIGLRVVDTEKMIEYPSASHRLVASEVDRTSREEEMRILYVAMTRARDRLILVGSRRDVAELRALGTADCAVGDGSRLAVATAQTPLDWLLPIMHASPVSFEMQGADRKAARAAGALFTVAMHEQAEIETWSARKSVAIDEKRVLQAVARLERLPADEPAAPDEAEVREVLERLNFTYPYLATTSVKATLSASGLKTGLERLSRSDEAYGQRFAARGFAVPPSKYGPAPVSDPILRGTLTHRCLQHLDFGKATGSAGLISELERLVQCGVLTTEECGAIDRDGLAWFLGTPLAARIREAGERYRREFRFVTTEAVRNIDVGTMTPEEDRVLVRGIVDGIIVRPDSIEVIDFKTDRITEEELNLRAEHYDAQMTVYAHAMSRLWGLPVRSCSLVFLTPRRIMSKPFVPQGQQVFSWMSQ